jgi:hypothetical protein
MEESVKVTCVYCGHAYPNETPTHGANVLKDHIKICPKHPMREAEQKIMLLRSALVGLVGSDDKKELEQMELMVRAIPAPDQDKANTINAIHAIIKTMSDENVNELTKEV